MEKRQRYFQALKIILTILIFLIAAMVSADSHMAAVSAEPLLEISGANTAEDDVADFEANDVRLVMKEDSRTMLRLSANSIVRRKRRSQLFCYQNLRELYLSGVRIDVFSNGKALPDTESNIPLAKCDSCGKTSLLEKHEKISMPVTALDNGLRALGKPLTSFNAYLAGTGDIDSNLLSRLILEDVSINLHLSPDNHIFFKATRAVIAVGSNNIVFEGAVRISDSEHNETSTSKAVWSNKYGGVYFPEGYKSQNTSYRAKTFYSLEKNGNFVLAKNLPHINYSDFLEEKERKIYSKILKKLPMQARFVLGMPLNQN